MKSLMSSTPVLWFLFLFNLVVAVVAAAAVDGTQGLMTGIGMGVVSIGAGAALLRRRVDRSLRAHLHSFPGAPERLDARNLD